MIQTIQLVGGLVVVFAFLPLFAGRIAVVSYKLIRWICGAS